MYNNPMNRSALFLSAFVFAGLSGCSATAVREATADQIPADGVDFKIALSEGDKYGYKLSMSMDGTAPAGTPGGTEVSMKLDIDQECEVTSVKDGQMSIQIKNTNVEASGPLASEITKGLESSTSTVVVDDRGRVINQEGAVDAGGGAGGTIYFPDKKVKPGDTWEKNTPGPNGQSILATYRFEAVHVLDGETVARISMTPTAVAEGVTLEGRSDYFVDLDTGMVVKMDGKLTTKANGQSVVTKLAMSRL